MIKNRKHLYLLKDNSMSISFGSREIKMQIM